jgi:hypothetical protein
MLPDNRSNSMLVDFAQDAAQLSYIGLVLDFFVWSASVAEDFKLVINGKRLKLLSRVLSRN